MDLIAFGVRAVIALHGLADSSLKLLQTLCPGPEHFRCQGCTLPSKQTQTDEEQKTGRGRKKGSCNMYVYRSTYIYITYCSQPEVPQSYRQR